MLQRFTKLWNTPSIRQLEPLVRQVAEASLEGVLDRIAQRTEGMTISEARGYVRARAAQIVRQQANLAIARHEVADATWKRVIVRAATERLVPQSLRYTVLGVPHRRSLPTAA